MNNIFAKTLLSFLFGGIYSVIAYLLVYGQLASLIVLILALCFTIVITALVLWINKKFIFRNNSYCWAFLSFLSGFALGVFLLYKAGLHITILIAIFGSLSEVEPPYLLSCTFIICEIAMAFIVYFCFALVLDIVNLVSRIKKKKQQNVLYFN